MAGADTGGGQLSFVPGNCTLVTIDDGMNNERSRTQRTRAKVNFITAAWGSGVARGV